MATLPATPLTGRADAAEPSDESLVAAVRAGDDRAFEALYARYQRRISAYVLGMVRDHGRSEDITQDVFVSALRRMRATDRQIAFKPWVYEIAKNACIDAFRRSRRGEEVSYDADGLSGGDQVRLASTAPALDDAVETRASLGHLQGAFGELSDAHHQILVLRELEGLTYAEIGERMGMSRPAVESTLFRARRRLTEEYQDLASGERCARVQAIVGDAIDGRLGLRDGRRVGRHVSSCQPCRRQAAMAGIDLAALGHATVRGKIAALLPLPVALKRRWLGGGSDAVATWSGSLDPGSVSTWGKGAMAAATVALAGLGAGVATNQVDLGGKAEQPSAAVAGPGGGGAQGAAGAVGASGAGVGAGATRTTDKASKGDGSRDSDADAGNGDGSGGAGGSGAGAGAADPSTSGAGDAARSASSTGSTGAGTGSTSMSTGSSGSSGGTSTTDSGSASDPPRGAVGQLADTVDGLTGGGNGSGTVNEVVRTVDGVTQSTTQAVQGVTGSVQGTLDQVGSSAQAAAPGPVGDTVKATTDTTGQVVKGVGDTVGGVGKIVGGLLR